MKHVLFVLVALFCLLMAGCAPRYAMSLVYLSVVTMNGVNR